tara:strand:- start:36 stop:683 length:648 start_codon:yes stop_codon:yes gene_type:complete
MSRLPVVGHDLSVWANDMRRYLGRQLDRLSWRVTGQTAAENGVILWDEAAGYPVVSKNGEWRQILLKDGQYSGVVSADQVATVINTPYALTYTELVANNITNGTPASRIVFEEAGTYTVSFSAQIGSTSASTVNFWFWPRINGVDVANASMKNALHQNGAVLVVSRVAAFTVAAGDYMEAMWAVSNVNGRLNATASTAFAPAAPASTIAIARIYG